jgi:hypothetical protein
VPPQIKARRAIISQLPVVILGASCMGRPF